MDLERAKTIISNQISSLRSCKLSSLQIQNHIYGCFVLMEDVDNSANDISGNTIIYPDNSYDFDTNFASIGITHGFIQDDKLILTDFNQDYKDFWLDCFNTIDITGDECIVDQVEDTLFDVLNKTIPNEESFFYNALNNNGMLTEEWSKNAHDILTPVELEKEKEKEKEKEREEGEKPDIVDKPTKKYSKTRRRATPIRKRNVYNKTRKNKGILTHR